MQFRSSSQLAAVDRTLGSLAVIGVSALFVSWLTSGQTDEEEQNTWWRPILALLRRKKKKQTDKDLEGDGCVPKQQCGVNDVYSHQGSCHCGAITFTLRGRHTLDVVESKGKIGYPHLPTSASEFQLTSGENAIRFYYEGEHCGTKDDASSITFEHAGEERVAESSSQEAASGAHGFCGKCGVHVFHADRLTGELEVNANCLDDCGQPILIRKATSRVMSSLTIETIDHSMKSAPPIETVSENEVFLGDARFWDALDDRDRTCPPRKESLSSEPTQSDSYSTSHMATDNDDALSIGSSSFITAASMHQYLSSVSVVSEIGTANHDRIDRAGRPPLPPSRHRSDRSVTTLPAHFGERPRKMGSGAYSSGWSIASLELNDDLDDGENSTISPTMHKQMRKYMNKYR